MGDLGDEGSQLDEYEGARLLELGFEAGEVNKVTVVRPDGPTIVDVGDATLTLEIQRPPVEGLPTTISGRLCLKASGATAQIEEYVVDQPVVSMPDVAVIRRAMQVAADFVKLLGTVGSQLAVAGRMLDWLASEEVRRLAAGGFVRVEAGQDDRGGVQYRIVINAGQQPGLTPEDLFADEGD
jgi:hypothetical protein